MQNTRAQLNHTHTLIPTAGVRQLCPHCKTSPYRIYVLYPKHSRNNTVLHVHGGAPTLKCTVNVCLGLWFDTVLFLFAVKWLQEASVWPPRLKPSLPLLTTSRERKLFILTNIDPCIWDHRQHAATHTRTHTHKQGGFSLYLGFSPWQKSSRRAR